MRYGRICQGVTIFLEKWKNGKSECMFFVLHKENAAAQQLPVCWRLSRHHLLIQAKSFDGDLAGILQEFGWD